MKEYYLGDYVKTASEILEETLGQRANLIKEFFQGAVFEEFFVPEFGIFLRNDDFEIKVPIRNDKKIEVRIFLDE